MVNRTIGLKQKSGFWRKFWVIAAPILIIVGFIVVTQIVIAANKKPEERKRSFNPLAVMADYAVRDDIQLSVKTQGEARPRTEIDLVPQVGGKIVYVSPNFIEGGIFKKGEVLVGIEKADYKVALMRAEASMAQAEQALVREEAEGEVARRDFEELGQGTPSALALREPQRRQAEAALQAAHAEVDSMKLQLTRTEVRAPFNGRVRVKSSDVGQFVAPGSRLGRIFSTNVVEVRLPLIDSELAKLDLPIAYVAPDRASAPEVALSATIAGKRQMWPGKIMRTDSSYDTQTRALFAIAEVFDPYGAGASEDGTPLAPGLFVDAEIGGKVIEDVIVLPRDGVRPDDEVYVIDEAGKAEIRKVNVLDLNPDRAVLWSGVEPGELVILSPLEKSRTALTLKALNVNNPSEVLVDPPAPEEDDAADSDDKDKDDDTEKSLKKSESDDSDNGSGENETAK